MEQSNKEKLFNIIFVLFYIFIFIFLFSFQNLNTYFYNNKIDDLFNYEYINFYENKENNSYIYYDYNSLFNKENSYTISADLYIENIDLNSTILDYNYKHEKLEKLNNNEALVSINLAKKHKLSIGDKIYLHKEEYMIKDLLPSLKGFNPKRNRDGVIKLGSLTKDDLSLNYMSFSNDKSLESVSSISIDEYKSNTKYYLSLAILLLASVAILIVPYYISKVLHKKTRIYYLEQKKFHKLYFSNLYNIAIKNFLVFIVFIPIYYYLITYKLYTNHLIGIYLLIIGLYLLINILLAFIYTNLWRKKDI